MFKLFLLSLSDSRGGHVDYPRVVVGVDWSSDYRLTGRLLRWFIPWSPLRHPCLYRMRNQPSNFLSLQGHELLLSIVLVKLRAEIHGMNSRIVAFHDDIVLSPPR